MQSGCDTCVLNAATTHAVGPHIDTSASIGTAPRSRTISGTYIQILEYVVTSNYFSGQICITTTGDQISLPEKSYLKPATAASMSFISDLRSHFIEAIGLTVCNNGRSATVDFVDAATITSFRDASTASVSTSLANGTLITAKQTSPSISPITSVVPTTSAPEKALSRFNKNDRIAIGTLVPVVVVAVLFAALFMYRRVRKAHKKSDNSSQAQIRPDASQPYLQQKAELEAEEQRRIELEARERRFEMSGEDTIHEAGHCENGQYYLGPNTRHALSSCHQRQELRGEEHSKELEVPSDL